MKQKVFVCFVLSTKLIKAFNTRFLVRVFVSFKENWKYIDKIGQK